MKTLQELNDDARQIQKIRQEIRDEMALGALVDIDGVEYTVASLGINRLSLECVHEQYQSIWDEGDTGVNGYDGSGSTSVELCGNCGDELEDEKLETSITLDQYFELSREGKVHCE